MPDFILSHVLMRIHQLKTMRSKWRGDPEYLKTLDMDIAGLDLLARELIIRANKTTEPEQC